MHVDATFRADELFLRQKDYLKLSGRMARTY
jgi:hypothetical protein